MRVYSVPGFAKAGYALILTIALGAQGVFAQNSTTARQPASEAFFSSPSQANGLAEEIPLGPVTWGEAFDKHAPLAFFSAASLAVGGILLAIRAENTAKISAHPDSPDRDMILALSAAGIGSLISGGAFWYYSRQEIDASRRHARLSVAPLLAHGGGIAANWRIRFSFGDG